MIPLIIGALVALALIALCARFSHHLNQYAHNRDLAWNGQLGLSEHTSATLGKYSDIAWAQRYLLMKVGSDWDHITPVAAVADEPMYVCIDSAYAAGERKACRLLNGHEGTQTMIAAGAIAAASDVYSDGTGKVTGVPAAAGTYWLVGKLVGLPPTAAGDMVEVEAIKPIKVVVLAALTSAQIGAAPTQANFNALQADVAALAAALATPCLIKHL